jgi:hypothetical protein
MEYKINKGDTITGINTGVVEVRKDAKYVGDFCVKTKTGWSDIPVSIFYQEHPPAPFSNYFGIYLDFISGKLMITDGSSVTKEPILGIASSTGEVVYSRYGHDFRSLENGEGSIDGGRSYTRLLGSKNGTLPATVEIAIQGADLIVTKVLSEARPASEPVSSLL